MACRKPFRLLDVILGTSDDKEGGESLLMLFHRESWSGHILYCFKSTLLILVCMWGGRAQPMLRLCLWSASLPNVLTSADLPDRVLCVMQEGTRAHKKPALSKLVLTRRRCWRGEYGWNPDPLRSKVNKPCAAGEHPSPVSFPFGMRKSRGKGLMKH